MRISFFKQISMKATYPLSLSQTFIYIFSRENISLLLDYFNLANFLVVSVVAVAEDTLAIAAVAAVVVDTADKVVVEKVAATAVVVAVGVVGIVDNPVGTVVEEEQEVVVAVDTVGIEAAEEPAYDQSSWMEVVEKQVNGNG